MPKALGGDPVRADELFAELIKLKEHEGLCREDVGTVTVTSDEPPVVVGFDPGGDAVEAHSAGSAASGAVNPDAVRVMAEAGVDMTGCVLTDSNPQIPPAPPIGNLPAKVLTNQDLERMVDTSDAWIRERTGIRQRHVVAEGETCVDLAEVAARRAIDADRDDRNRRR